MSPREQDLRPFYFTVVFWGALYRGYFTDLLLSSLLSPNNIPALNRRRKSKFLIVTTRSDWDALQSNVLFHQLARYVEPVWIEMPFPKPKELKMLVMSKGHRLATSKAFEDRAYGVFVTPDLVLSDGSVAAMERLAEAGKKVVLSVAIRFRHESLLAELENEGYLKPDLPLVLPPRELMRMALRNLHTETLRYEFDAPYFEQPISVYWWVMREKGMIIHSFSWAPLVVDYGALQDHDTSTFEEWTMDGDYIYRNFPGHQDVYVVTDSDEIVLVSFTKESDLHFDLVAEPQTTFGGRFESAYKVGLIRAMWKSTVMDPLKRDIFAKPVYLHSAELDRQWREKRRYTDALIERALHPRTIEERFILDVSVRAGQSRFADWVLRRFSDDSPMAHAEQTWLLAISVWLILIRPRHIVQRRISVLLQPLMRASSRASWLWRYRRFVWWELKEKLGVVEERDYDWQNSGWEAPGISLVCPIFTVRWLWRNRTWLWRYRRFVWWRLKEKLGWEKERHFDSQNSGWEAPGVSVVCPLFTIRWMWRNRTWLWRSRRFVWWRLMEKLGWERSSGLTGRRAGGKGRKSV